MQRRMAPTISMRPLYTLLALLVGMYAGVNLAGIHYHHRERMDELQSLPDLQNQHTALNNIQPQPNEECNHEEDTPNIQAEAKKDTPKKLNPNQHPLCQQLPYPTPSAMALWNYNILNILKATRLPNDAHYKFHDFTTQLLQIITPRLQRSVKSIPHEWASLERVMTVVWDRYQYLQLPPQDRAKISVPPRPLKILVMGGSLIVGTNCRKLLTELGLSFRLPKRDCTWSNRLLQFLNSYAGGDLVHVSTVAMGGTNTATGSVIWKYDLIPEQAREPDIVLNAYSTNDMHILTILEAETANITLRDKVFDMTQEFVRNVLHTCDPKIPPPLLLHVDDYLGNEQRKIWDTTELSQGIQVLANYYGFASLSYADVVREVVYGDTTEAWLSSNWWETGSFEREIHPGMGMHIASTWVTVYNILNLVTTYCSIPPTPPDFSISDYQVGIYGLPPLKGDVKQAKYKPKQHPTGLPPVLTKDLLIEDVTRLWQEASQNIIPCDPDKVRLANSEHQHSKCPFSWVSGLSLQQNNQTWIQEHFRGRASLWEGWELGNDGGKLGFVPATDSHGRSIVNSTSMVLEFEFPQTIRSVTLFYMKSYGEKWHNSRLQIRAWTDLPANNVLAERFVAGVHDKSTSEMYTEALELSPPVSIGSILKIQTTLVGGTMFKIMGLAVCS